MSVIIVTRVTARCCLVLKGASVDVGRRRSRDTGIDPSTNLMSVHRVMLEGCLVTISVIIVYCFVAV